MEEKNDSMEINIKKLKEGSENEFEKFYRIYLNRIYTVIYRVVGNEADAEDLTQEVMMKIYDKISTFRGDAKLSSWVYRVAYNHSISHIRRKKESESLDASDYTFKSDADRHIEYLEKKEEKEYIKEKLMELPEKYRVALTLYHFEDLSYREIAYAMGIKMGTVKTYIYRGREELKNLLDEYSREAI